MAFLKNTQAWEIFFTHIGSSYSFKRSKYRDQCCLIVRSRESDPPRSSAGTPFSVLPRPSGPRQNGCHHFMTCLCPLLPRRLRAPPKQGHHPISVFLFIQATARISWEASLRPMGSESRGAGPRNVCVHLKGFTGHLALQTGVRIAALEPHVLSGTWQMVEGCVTLISLVSFPVMHNLRQIKLRDILQNA